MEVIRNNMAARQNDLRLYLDVIADPAKVFDVVTVFSLNNPSSAARPTPSIYNDIPKALRYIKTIAIWCWENIYATDE